MESFIQSHKSIVTGVLSGFDRLRMRGTLRRVSSAEGMTSYLNYIGVLLKDFGGWVDGVTKNIRGASRAVAASQGRPIIYLQSPGVRKDEVAREIWRKDKIESGLICVLEAVEPCWSFELRKNKEKKRLELVSRYRKCIHTYHYEIDPTFGFMHTRLQTWFPFNVHVCLNGREWLSRQLDAAGIGYARRENCFVSIADVAAAQELFARQLQTNWPKELDALVARVSPGHRTEFSSFPLHYYWSAEESEWATDVMFRSAADLSQLYGRLLSYGMTTFDSREVLRFLGHKVPLQGGVHGRFAGEIMSDMRQRPEGIRLKHRVNKNSIKMYDKQGSVLRVETTINNTRDFKVFRRPEGQPEAQQSWQKLRKGVADLHRRAEISQAANERYLEALAAVEDQQKLADLLDPLSKRKSWNGARVRALNIFQKDDLRLIKTIARGEFHLNGFQNKDLRNCLFPTPINNKTKRQLAARVTRMIRLLRAHGIIAKVKGSYRYRITQKGKVIAAAIDASRNANTQQLQKLAA